MTNKLELLLDHVDEQGKSELKLIKINVGKAINQNTASFMRSLPQIYKLTFSVKIPDHIYEALKNQSVPRGRDMHTYQSDYLQRIKGESLENITKRWSQVIEDYKWLLAIQNAQKQKVIFYGFESESRDFNSQWNGVRIGMKNNLDFKYAIGYIGEMPKHGKTEPRYNDQYRYLSQSYHSDFYKLKYIAWTQEREDFFHRLQQAFESLLDRIAGFEANLAEELIDKMIAASGGKNLLTD